MTNENKKEWATVAAVCVVAWGIAGGWSAALAALAVVAAAAAVWALVALAMCTAKARGFDSWGKTRLQAIVAAWDSWKTGVPRRIVTWVQGRFGRNDRK